MPQEDRRIIFSFEEAYKALYALCMQKEMKRPPPGYIVSVQEVRGEEKRLEFKIENNQEEVSRTIEYSRDFLAAALMLFCRSQSIPIPKRGNKSVMINDDNVVLRVQVR